MIRYEPTLGDLTIICTIVKVHLYKHLRDTDSNKSWDFLLTPVCMMLIYILCEYVLLCKYLCIVHMK